VNLELFFRSLCLDLCDLCDCRMFDALSQNYCLLSNNSRGHLVNFKDKQRGSERIVFKLESEKSKSVRSHQMAAVITRGKTVEQTLALPIDQFSL
jgi:hypothetical protein